MTSCGTLRRTDLFSSENNRQHGRLDQHKRKRLMYEQAESNNSIAGYYNTVRGMLHTIVSWSLFHRNTAPYIMIFFPIFSRKEGHISPQFTSGEPQDTTGFAATVTGCDTTRRVTRFPRKSTAGRPDSLQRSDIGLPDFTRKSAANGGPLYIPKRKRRKTLKL